MIITSKIMKMDSMLHLDSRIFYSKRLVHCLVIFTREYIVRYTSEGD